MSKYKKYDLDQLISETLAEKLKRTPPPSLTPTESWNAVEYKRKKNRKYSLKGK
ncbi:hypothetical protein ACXYMX_08635 [Sporosarcina sp. CAU 1771]